MNQQSDKISFLSDEPAEEDYFNTHTELADAIAAAIQTNAHLRVIGLLGRWGSGKSTVISKLEQRLHSGVTANNIVFFTYDAWLNQSDPQKRAFLETFVKFLIKGSHIEEGRWNKELKKLSGSIEESETIENPVFSKEAKLFALSIIPAVAFFGILDLDVIRGAFEYPPSDSAVLSMRLLIASIFLPGLTWIGVNVARLFRNEPIAVLPPLFANDSRKRIFTHVEKSADPTSLEFARAFRRLVRELSADGKRLIIVIDNIDRVSASDAVNIWANIRNMFLQTHDSDHVQRNINPTIILPFDDNAIHDLFSNPDDDQLRPDVTESFLDKTFDASFYVPEPVMSDWRSFLEKQLATAFDNSLEQDQVFWCTRFVEQRHSDHPFHITPRYLNKTVNRIAAMAMQWQGRVSFYAISYYAINRDLCGKIRELVFGQAPLLSAPEPDWQRQCAAIHYGVEPVKAGQILIEAPMREAVQRRDVNAFIQLASVPGFDGVFGGFARRLAAGENTSRETILNSGFLLETLGDGDEHWRKESWHSLSDGLISSLKNSAVKNDFLDRARSFLSKFDDEQKNTFLEISVDLLISAMERAETTSDSLKSLDGLVDQAFDLKPSRADDWSQISVESEATIFLARWPSINANAYRLRVELDPEELTDALRSIVDDAITDDDTSLHAMPVLLQRIRSEDGKKVLGGSEPDWVAIGEHLSEIVRQPSSVKLKPIWTALVDIACTNEAARSDLSNLCDEGHVLTRFNELRGGEDHTLLASLAGVLISKNIEFACPGEGISWEAYLRTHSDFPDGCLASLNCATDKVTIYALADAYDKHGSLRPLLQSIVRLQLNAGDLGRLNMKKVSQRYYYYSRIAPWGMSSAFANALSRRNDFWENLGDAEWGADMDRLASSLLERSNKDASKAQGVLQTRVQTASEEAWLSAIRDSKGPYTILTKLLSNWDPQLGKKSTLYCALESSLNEIVGGAGKKARSRWFELLEAINGRFQSHLLSQMIDVISNTASPAKVYELAALGGTALAKSAKSHRDANLVVSALIIPLTRHATGRGFLRDHATRLKGVISAIDAKSKKHLKRRFEQMGRSRFSDQKSFADTVQRTWKL